MICESSRNSDNKNSKWMLNQQKIIKKTKECETIKSINKLMTSFWPISGSNLRKQTTPSDAQSYIGNRFLAKSVNLDFWPNFSIFEIIYKSGPRGRNFRNFWKFSRIDIVKVIGQLSTDFHSNRRTFDFFSQKWPKGLALTFFQEKLKFSTFCLRISRTFFLWKLDWKRMESRKKFQKIFKIGPPWPQSVIFYKKKKLKNLDLRFGPKSLLSVIGTSWLWIFGPRLKFSSGRGPKLHFPGPEITIIFGKGRLFTNYFGKGRLFTNYFGKGRSLSKWSVNHLETQTIKIQSECLINRRS